MTTKVSIVNLVPRFQGESIKEAIDRMVRLAQFADKKGYDRYWIAEHHNTRAVVSSATDLLILQTLHHTQRIRVGSGGVMLPNHTPFQVAERYGTLESLFPGRVDLGIGRAPGTDLETAKLIYRNTYHKENFKEALKELLGYFGRDHEGLTVLPHPGAGAQVPIFILGSSLTSAHIAAELGLPYSFAAHFSPHTLEEAVRLYRSEFKPSASLKEPYVQVTVSTNIAKTKERAKILNDHAIQVFLRLLRPEVRDELLTLDPDRSPELTSIEKVTIRVSRGLNIGGDPSEARDQWMDLKERVQPDEVFGVTYIPEEEDLLTNYDLFYDMVKNS